MRYKAAITTLLVATVAAFSSGKRFYITRHGPCTDCDYHGNTNYLWCHLGTASHDWDYCSTKPGHTTRGHECKAGHECGYYGYSYLWCFLKDGGWDYCSLIEDTTLLQFTVMDDQCHNYCDLEFGVYVCRKDDYNSDGCSPVDGVASNGLECKSLVELSNCSKSETDELFWSGTKKTSWSCSTNTDIKYEEIQRYVQQLNNGAVLITVMAVEKANRHRIRLATGTQRHAAQQVIFKWHKDEKSNGDSVIVQIFSGIQLNQKGFVQTVNYGMFMDWQLKITGRNISAPTTVAQVLIPSELQSYAGPTQGPTRGWRRMLMVGLHHSLNRGAKVWIFQHRKENSNRNLQCPMTNNDCEYKQNEFIVLRSSKSL